MRRRFNQRGVTTLELAIILPFLLLLLLGGADFARVFDSQIRLVSAARAGAHYGSRTTTGTTDYAGMMAAAKADANLPTMTSTAESFCYCNGQPPIVACTVVCVPPDITPQRYVKVTASDVFHTSIAYPGIPSNIPLSSTAIERAQ